MSYSSYGGYSGGDIAGNIIIMVGIIIIVAMLTILWLLVKAVNCIARGFAANPKSKALWLALIVFCVSVGLMVYVYLTRTDQTWYTIAETALGLSFIGLVITARCVELSQSTHFERERDSHIDEVLHRPWWNMEDRAQEEKQAA